MIVYAAEKVGMAGMGGGVAAGFELEALRAGGRPVSVLTLGPAPGGYDAGAEWIDLDFSKAPTPELSADYLRFQWQALRTVRAVRRLKPSLLVAQSTGGHRIAERAREWGGVPRVMTLHGSPAQVSGAYGEGAAGFDRSLREIASYNAVVIPSARVADEWKRQPTLESMTFRVIPNHCDEARAAAALDRSRDSCRASLGLGVDDFVVTCLGSVQYRKGQDILLDALALIDGSIPRLNVLLAGPVLLGWGGREILRRIEASPLRPRVSVLGVREDTFEILRASDAMVLPSRDECLPLSILEAMAVGTPVIASNVAGNPEMIEHGVTGWLFDPERPEGLAGALREVFDDPGRAQSLAETARQKYHDVFSRHRYLGRWQEVVNEYARP
jgi:glycosyltransferase involved in cell wall biosynthesis